jgi:hypothetical protein
MAVLLTVRAGHSLQCGLPARRCRADRLPDLFWIRSAIAAWRKLLVIVALEWSANAGPKPAIGKEGLLFCVRRLKADRLLSATSSRAAASRPFRPFNRVTLMLRSGRGFRRVRPRLDASERGARCIAPDLKQPFTNRPERLTFDPAVEALMFGLFHKLFRSRKNHAVRQLLIQPVPMEPPLLPKPRTGNALRLCEDGQGYEIMDAEHSAGWLSKLELGEVGRTVWEVQLRGIRIDFRSLEAARAYLGKPPTRPYDGARSSRAERDGSS